MCVWVTSGGQSAWVVHSASDPGGLVRWKIASRGAYSRGLSRTRELPLARYRDADSLQPEELRLLLACVPARTPSLLLLLTQPLEVRPDDSRVELEANAAVVAKGNRDELQRRRSRRVHRRDGPIVLAVLTSSCLGFGRGSERRGLGVTCASSCEGGGEVLSGHRKNDGEVDTHESRGGGGLLVFCSEETEK